MIIYIKLLFKCRRVPLILLISNKNSEDVTAKILPYVGPNYDWHNSRLTPGLLGEKLLAFELYNGAGFTCLEHDLLPIIEI